MAVVVPGRATIFRENVIVTLSYWRERTRDLDDRAIDALDKERRNLFRAVQFGLSLPQAWETTAAIAVQVIPLVNRRMYRREWLPVLQQLLDQAPPGQERWRFRLLVQFGRMLRLQRQLDQALAIHHEARMLAETVGDIHLRALVTYNLGRDYLDRRQYAAAERYSWATIEMLHEDGSSELVAQAFDILGQAARQQGDLENSLNYLTKALEIKNFVGEGTTVMRALQELANTLRAAGRQEEAIAHYKEALEKLAPTGNELDKTLINLNLGGAYFDIEEWSSAEKALRKANSAYLRQSGNIHYRAAATVSLGNVLVKQDRLVEAEGMLRESIRLWQQLNDNLNLANAMGTLGEVLAARGNTEAEEYLTKALVLLSEYRDEPRAERLRNLFQIEKDKLPRNMR